MKTWKSVPIPELMKDLELDKRGYPIPYIVLKDKNGISHFAINDDRVVEQCIEKDLCSICGKKLNEDKWMIGGPLSTFHPMGTFIDIPVHHQCGKYALQVCPYLAVTVYHAKTDVEKIDSEKFDNAYFINPTQSKDRVPFFVFSHISGYSIRRPRFGERFIYPNKPYLNLEYWNAGKEITQEEVIMLMREKELVVNAD